MYEMNFIFLRFVKVLTQWVPCKVNKTPSLRASLTNLHVTHTSMNSGKWNLFLKWKTGANSTQAENRFIKCRIDRFRFHHSTSTMSWVFPVLISLLKNRLMFCYNILFSNVWLFVSISQSADLYAHVPGSAEVGLCRRVSTYPHSERFLEKRRHRSLDLMTNRTVQ